YFKVGWCPYARSGTFFDAIGKNLSKTGPIGRCWHPLYLSMYGPNYWRHHGFFCYAWRYQHQRTWRIDWLCRPSCGKRYNRSRIARRFQTAEFLLEHGFLDFITERKDLKNKINLYLDLITNQPL